MSIEQPTNNGKGIARNEKGQLLPGSVLNPKGPPKGIRHMSTRINEILLEKIPNDPEQRTYKEMLLKRILSKAIEKVDPALVNIVLDRSEGKPLQEVDVTSGGERIGAGTLVDTELDAMAEELAIRLKKKKTKQLE